MRRAAVGFGLALLALGGDVSAQTVVIGVGGQLTGQVGGQLAAPVYADMRGAPGQKLGSYTLRLQWDPAVLEFVGVDLGAFGQPVLGTDSAYYGVLRVGGLSAEGLDGLFNLFAVRLAVLDSATTALTLTVSEAIAAGSFTNLTSFVTVVSGSYCPAAGRWGDLDRDGQANSRDALAILTAVVGLPVDPAFTLALGDVDGDGIVNSRDALITLTHAVGLSIPGQRVLVLVPGACGGGGALGITILPDTVDVAVGQATRLLLSGAIGGVPAGTSVNWSVGNPELAVVSAEGLLQGRSAGTTTVSAALGPGITATVPVIVRARRINWYVDAGRAPLASIQLGTQRYPFATPQYAFPIVQDGDTIRIAPGVHDYIGGDLCTGGYYGDSPPAEGGPPAAPPPELCALYGELRSDVVLWGDTLADGTRPVLRGNPENDRMVELYNGVSFEMHHLDIRGFQQSVYQSEPTRKVLVRNVRFDLTSPYTYDAFTLYYGLDTLILRDVEFVGDSAVSGGYAVYASDGIGLVVMERIVIDNVSSGVYLYGVDSLDVRDSDLRPSRYEAIYLEGADAGSQIYLTRNQFRAVFDVPGYFYNVESFVSERNVYRLGTTYGGLFVYGRYYPPKPGTRFRSFADSILAEPRGGSSGYAYYVDDLDSVTVDSAVVTGPDSGLVQYPGYLYGGAQIRVRGSRFTNVSGSPFYLAARNVEVANSSFTGCRVACTTAYGVQIDGYADSVALFQVTGNTFFRVTTAVDTYYYGDVHRVVATGNTIDSVDVGLQLSADSSLVADNVLTRAGTGGSGAISLSPRYARTGTAATLQRNRVTAVGGYALYASSAGITSMGNRYTGRAYGVWVANGSGSDWSLTMDRDTMFADSAPSGYTVYLSGNFAGSIRRSRILGGGYGMYAPVSGTLVLDSNVVSGSRTYGLYLSAAAGTSITGRWNNVTDNRTYGIYTSGAATFAFTDGRFVLNRDRAVYAASGSVNAMNNYWGPSGPSSAGDTVFGAVTIVPFTTVDPAGVSVPPLAPPAGALVAELWRAPIGGLAAGPADPPVRLPSRSSFADRVERTAWRAAQRAEGRNRIRERRAELELRRVAQQRELRPRE